jgi:hypothetical protein
VPPEASQDPENDNDDENDNDNDFPDYACSAIARFNVGPRSLIVVILDFVMLVTQSSNRHTDQHESHRPYGTVL